MCVAAGALVSCAEAKHVALKHSQTAANRQEQSKDSTHVSAVLQYQQLTRPNLDGLPMQLAPLCMHLPHHDQQADSCFSVVHRAEMNTV